MRCCLRFFPCLLVLGACAPDPFTPPGLAPAASPFVGSWHVEALDADGSRLKFPHAFAVGGAPAVMDMVFDADEDGRGELASMTLIDGPADSHVEGARWTGTWEATGAADFVFDAPGPGVPVQLACGLEGDDLRCDADDGSSRSVLHLVRPGR